MQKSSKHCSKLVRPRLDYANQSWKPYLKKHILMLESVQRRATRLVPGFGNLSYGDRLKELNIPALEYRRRRGRMIEVYKILNECYDRKATEGLFELNERETRGNPYQLKTKKPRLANSKNFFAVAAVADWNSLPDTVVRCDNVNAFKRSLDSHWEHEMFNTEFFWEMDSHERADRQRLWPTDQKRTCEPVSCDCHENPKNKKKEEGPRGYLTFATLPESVTMECMKIGIIDTGCTMTVAGEPWYQAFKSSVSFKSTEDRPDKTSIIFGDCKKVDEMSRYLLQLEISTVLYR